MFDLKNKLGDFRPPLLANSISINCDVKQTNVYIDTIKVLTQQILKLELQLVQTRHFAYHDVLTGLANRCLLRDRFNQAINQVTRHHKQVGLLLLDLNSFKKVNDTLGHNVGDQLLIQSAKRIVECIRVSDSTYRYGGDEFVILLPEIEGTEGLTELISKLKLNLSKPYLLGENKLIVTASIGFAIYPADGLTQDDLIRHADTAMYQEKNTNNDLNKNA